jgi:hypothetical protein
MFCLPPFTLRDRTTTIALDMLDHYALTDKIFETPGWSKVVMVDPTGMKPVKLIGAARPSRRARMSDAPAPTTVTKSGSTMTEWPTDATAPP